MKIGLEKFKTGCVNAFSFKISQTENNTVMLQTFPTLSTNEVDHNEVEDHVGEDEISESSFRANASKLGLVGWVHLRKNV